MTRTFGVELEIVHSGDSHVGFVGRVTRALRNAGLARQIVEVQGYGSADYNTWQINRDGSVSRNYIPGAEVVSRILPATEEGFAELSQACDLIAGAGATVNRTCGMHVHVDVRDLSVDEIRRVVIAYVRFQAEIDSVVPRSRRGGNQYCRHMTSTWRTADILTASLEQCSTVSGMANAIGGKYYVLNLSKFPYTGTIEFRQHSGTVEADKAVAWARWCVAFVETFRHAAPVAVAPCSEEVIERYQARGEMRLPSRGPSLAMIRRLQAGPARWEELAALATNPDEAEPSDWLKWCATRYGVGTVLTAAGWQLDNGQSATAAASPFEACFMPGGQIGYFGRRRRALSR
jgi:hypothetical protein